MNTKKELSWWLAFSQKDLAKAKKKTIEKLHAELLAKLSLFQNPFTRLEGATKSSPQLILTLPLPPGQEIPSDYTPRKVLEGFQVSAAKITSNIVRWVSNRKKTPSLIFATSATQEATANGLESGTILALNDLAPTARYYDIIAYHICLLLDGTNRDDFGFCDYCGNLFIRVAQTKKNKKFCTTYCAVKSSNEQETRYRYHSL